jgi:phosphatidylglycerophosphate synthase
MTLARARPANYLERWSRQQAVLLAAGFAWELATRSALPLGAAGTLGFGWLLWLGKGRYTGQGHFGAANGITFARLVITLCLGAVPSALLAPTLLLALCLDGADGFVARRTASAAEFGAHFDMEADAFFVLVASSELWRRGLFGPWALAAGPLRALYVLSLWAVPGSGREAPRSNFGRRAFLALAVGLIAPWALPRAWGGALLALGIGAVLVSFARSFFYSYAKSAG